MSIRKWLVGVVAVVVLVGATAAYADIIRFDFSGTVTHINDHGAPFLDDSIALGTPLTGSYVFDPDASDQFPTLSYLGVYRQQIAEGASFGLEVGNYGLDLLDGYYRIQVENDGGSGNDNDKYEVNYGTGSRTFTNGIDTFTEFGFVLNLRDFDTGEVFTNDSLPTSLDLSLFDNDQGDILITVVDHEGNDTDVIATITSLKAPAPVPEPSTLATLGGLLGMGLIAGWWRRRRGAA